MIFHRFRMKKEKFNKCRILTFIEFLQNGAYGVRTRDLYTASVTRSQLR